MYDGMIGRFNVEGESGRVELAEIGFEEIISEVSDDGIGVPEDEVDVGFSVGDVSGVKEAIVNSIFKLDRMFFMDVILTSEEGDGGL